MDDKDAMNQLLNEALQSPNGMVRVGVGISVSASMLAQCTPGELRRFMRTKADEANAQRYSDRGGDAARMAEINAAYKEATNG